MDYIGGETAPPPRPTRPPPQPRGRGSKGTGPPARHPLRDSKRLPRDPTRFPRDPKRFQLRRPRARKAPRPPTRPIQNAATASDRLGALECADIGVVEMIRAIVLEGSLYLLRGLRGSHRVGALEGVDVGVAERIAVDRTARRLGPSGCMIVHVWCMDCVGPPVDLDPHLARSRRRLPSGGFRQSAVPLRYFFVFLTNSGMLLSVGAQPTDGLADGPCLLRCGTARGAD